jgi:hypothetical protein
MRRRRGMAAALLALAALATSVIVPARAQVPALQSLSSTWQPVRFCRPGGAAMCPAGGTLDAKACADYGCCHDGGTRCYAPNGEDRLSIGTAQEVFAANQAVPAIAQPGAALSVDSSGDVLGVMCFDAPPFAGTCGPHSFGLVRLDNTSSAALTTGLTTRWSPHQIARNATLWRHPSSSSSSNNMTDKVRASSIVRMGFDSQTVLLRLELEALSADQAPLNLSINLAALVFAQTNGWAWPITRPNGKTDGFVTSVRTATAAGVGGSSSRGGALTVHAGSNTSSASAFGSSTPPPDLRLVSSPLPSVVASWPALQLKLGAPVVIELALAIGHNEPATVEQAADAIALDFPSAWAAAETDWSDWWRSAFDPAARDARTQEGRSAFSPAVVFEGQLPTLMTEDEAMKRTYYMGAVTLLTMARHDIVPESQWFDSMCFGSAGVESAFAAMYIWDTTLNSLLLTLLAPTYFQSMIGAWLGMGIHSHYAVDYVSNKGKKARTFSTFHVETAVLPRQARDTNVRKNTLKRQKVPFRF